MEYLRSACPPCFRRETLAHEQAPIGIAEISHLIPPTNALTGWGSDWVDFVSAMQRHMPSILRPPFRQLVNADVSGKKETELFATLSGASSPGVIPSE